MPVSGGIDQFQRNIVGKNHTIIDLGVIIAQRGDIVSIGNGSVATIGTQSVCIGYNANDNGGNYIVVIGPNNAVGTVCPKTTMVGSGLSLGNTSASATLMGNTITVSATNANAVTIGSALILGATSPSTTLIGHSIVVAASSDRSIVIGASNSTTGAFPRSNLIGNGILWDYGISSTCLGSNITMNGACDYGVVIGSNITFFAGGGDRDQEVVICASPTISPTLIAQNSIHLVLIGSNALFVGPNSSESIILGREGQIAWGGTIGSPQTIAIGFQVNIADNASGAVIIGALAGCVADAQYSTVVGFNAHANGKAGIAIGAGAVAPSRYCVIGNSNDAYYLTNLQVMGDDAAPFFEVYGNIPVPRVSIDLGLKVWDGWTLNQVSCAAVPPIGARLLYIL